MELHEQLRHHANTLRTNSMPLADLIPLLQKVADRLEHLEHMLWLYEHD